MWIMSPHYYFFGRQRGALGSTLALDVKRSPLPFINCLIWDEHIISLRLSFQALEIRVIIFTSKMCNEH